MWSRSLAWKQPDGTTKPFSVLLLDTEGTDSLGKDTHSDAKLQSLVCILASLFVVNSKSILDAKSLADLSSLTHFSSLLDTQGKKNPALLWLLRDFQLELSKNDRPLSEDEYLEEFLRGGDSSPDLWELKTQLNSFFRERSLRTLSHPGEELTGAMATDLSVAFLSGFERMMLAVGAALERVDAVPCTMLARLLQSSVDLVNGGQIVKLDSLWTNIVRSEDETVFKEVMAAAKKFEARMQSSLPLNTRDLLQRVDTARRTSVAEFEARFALDTGILKSRRAQLEVY